jgi:hypothetical protein
MKMTKQFYLGFLFLGLLWVGCGSGNQSRADFLDSTQTILDSLTYPAIVHELQLREQWATPSEEFKQYVTEDLERAKSLYERAFVAGQSPQEFLDSLQNGFKVLTEEKLIAILNEDNRYFAMDSIHVLPFMRDSSLEATVLLLPFSKKFVDTVDGKPQLKVFPLASHARGKSIAGVRFEKANSTVLGTRSGVLIGKRWVLTAGHGLQMGESIDVLRAYSDTSNYKSASIALDSSKLRKAQVKYVEFGGPQQPDFALLELVNDYSVPGLPFPAQSGTIAPGDSLFCAQHPLGMPLIVDRHGQVGKEQLNYTGGPYFLADLDVNTGSSGAPVFKYTKVDGKFQVNWVGIVVGSGGLEDWQCDGKSCKWNQRSLSNAVGTRVLSVEAMRTTFCAVTKSCSSLNKLPSCSCLTSKPGTNKFCLSEYNAGVEGQDWVMVDSKGKKSPFPLADGLVMKLSPCSLEVFPIATLESRYDSMVWKMLESCEVHWPLSDLARPDCPIKLAERQIITMEPDVKFPSGQTYTYLDGIGIADIVDELPSQRLKKHLRFLFEGEYIELSILKTCEGISGNSLVIRWFKPFVHVYQRTEVDTSDFKK